MGNAPKEELCRQLVHLSMGGDDRDRTVNILKSADKAVWESALRTLAFHGVLPLIAYSLRAQHLEPFLPKPLSAELRKIHRDTCLINQRYLACLGEILELLRARGIEPLLWKGCAVLDQVWPEVGTRILGDLDLFIEPSEWALSAEVLTAAGFRMKPQFRVSSATCINAEGISVDLQYKEMGHGKWASDPALLKHVTRKVAPFTIPVSFITSLEPAAMLAGLACHFARHDCGGSSQGISFRWLLDLHFVLRRWGTEINTNHLFYLTDTNPGLALLLRAVGFFCGEMGMRYEGCEELESLGAQFEPLTFREILRSRRLGVWGLPTAETGWLCLFAHCLRVHTQSGLTVPLLSDFANIIPDIYRKRRMSRRAAALRQQLAATQSSQ